MSDSLISRIRRGLIWTEEARTDNHYAAIDRALILTAALTGGRQGELLALRWQDAGALDDLHRESAFQADDDLVFGHPETGKPLDRSQVLKRFKRYCSDAGVRKHVRFHDLRHTFGTRMAAAGIPIRTIQEWMGHADSKTMQIYADYSPAENEAALVDAAFAPVAPVPSMDQVMDQSERN